MDKFRRKLNSYFQQTTLHGFAYISASQTWTERIFWILALLWSLSCCIFLIYELTEKVVTNPIIIQQPDKPVHIKDIPFPAVSFCPVHFTEDPYIMYSSLLVNNSVTFPPDLSNYTQCGSNWKNLDNYVINPIEFRGNWMRKFRTKSDYVISPFGWCMTFNSLDYEKNFIPNTTAEYFQFQKRILKVGRENLEYEKVDGKRVFKQFNPESPLRTARKELGLFMACLRYMTHRNPECPQHKQRGVEFGLTFTVVIHSPFERPDVRHKNYVTKDQQTYSIEVTAEIEATHENLLDLDLDERRCYKENEKELKVFKIYTRINCLRECESFFIFDKCGCVPYHFVNKNATLICTPAQMTTCFEPEYASFNESSCKCYSLCEQLNYHLDIQMAEVNYIDLLKFTEIVENFIVVTFKDDSFFPQVRRKYFTMIDWFSFVGGILGLFFGFSFLSGFEMIFHVWLGFFGSSSMERSTSRRSWMWKRVVDYLKSFMDSSSIHGFSYISDSTMRIFERLAWSITFILSITACGFMIVELKLRLTIDSISMISSDQTVNLTEFPFPAATMIFPGNPIYYNSAKGSPRLDEIHKLAHFAVNRNDRLYSWFTTKDPKFGYLGHELVPFIRKQTTLRNDFLPWITWSYEEPVPGQTIITSRGLVFNFNMIDCDEMFNKENVSKNFYYTLRYLQNGPKNTTIVPVPKYPSFTNNEQLVFVRSFPEWGFFEQPAIFFHSPFEFPFEFIDQFNDRVILRHKKILDVLITLDVVTTDDDLKALPVDQRKCYLENERKLKFFKIYTQRNCQIECLSQVMLNTCECVPFDIIRENDTKVCEIPDEECFETVRLEFRFDDNSCSCLQLCDSYSFNYEFVQTNHRDYNATKKISNNYQEQLDTTKWHLGFVTVKFKEKEFATMQRVRTFTTVDFLSYIGGLLGLFAGISVLSLFEIFYFLTLRLLCEILKHFHAKRRIRNANVQIIITAPVE